MAPWAKDRLGPWSFTMGKFSSQGFSSQGMALVSAVLLLSAGLAAAAEAAEGSGMSGRLVLTAEAGATDAKSAAITDS